MKHLSLKHLFTIGIALGLILGALTALAAIWIVNKHNQPIDDTAEALTRYEDALSACEQEREDAWDAQSIQPISGKLTHTKSL